MHSTGIATACSPSHAKMQSPQRSEQLTLCRNVAKMQRNVNRDLKCNFSCEIALRSLPCAWLAEWAWVARTRLGCSVLMQICFIFPNVDQPLHARHG